MFVIYATPYFTPNALQFIQAVANLPDITFGLISQEPQELLPSHIREKVVAHWRIDDALNPGQLVWAAQSLSQRIGQPIHRLLSALEQIQVPLAEARERLGISGMSVEVAKNFRDKARMKDLLRQAGLPCARHGHISSESQAWAFAQEIGYPLVLKPLAGAGTQTTFQIDNADDMLKGLRAVAPHPGQPAILEEFITGEEHSFETISINGRSVWHSLTHYLPSPLDAMRHPWIQWCLLLPRGIDDPEYDDVREIGRHALTVLGMDTGLSHLEWFRRRDGSLAISEVGARPPGAQIPTMMSRANDIDMVGAWARLMVFGTFDPPTRKYAVGTAFLRGQGQGRVKAIHGLEQAGQEVGHLVTDFKLPEVGQAASTSYEGEGYVMVRHEETAVVAQALKRLINLVRVELG
jgi:phosphoribosylaminoimidazole carboxylase (NCAIR synthetase)